MTTDTSKLGTEERLEIVERDLCRVTKQLARSRRRNDWLLVGVVLAAAVAVVCLTALGLGLTGSVKGSTTLPAKNMEITDQDLTPENVAKTDYRGAKLLLDGYVVEIMAKEGKFGAIIAAGSVPPGKDREPILLRMNNEGVTYQIQTCVTGDLVTKLSVDDVPRRVMGIIRDIKVEKGNMFSYSYYKVHGYETEPGLVISVSLDKITIAAPSLPVHVM